MPKILEILLYPDPRLRRKCLPVERFDASVRTLGESMLKTMYASSGIGLAAAQVNVLKRVIVIDINQEPGEAKILVNPELMSTSGSTSVEEGCLSVPGMFAHVKRAESITVRYCTPEGKQRTFDCEGMLAICIQHEIDHLNGRLFVDHLPMHKRIRARMIARKYHTEQQLARP